MELEQGPSKTFVAGSSPVGSIHYKKVEGLESHSGKSSTIELL